MSKKTTETMTFTKTLTLNDGGLEIILAVDKDVDAVLAGSMRAEPAYGEGASHRTQTTRKYQCNAPLAWEEMIEKVGKKNGLATGGAAIRAVLLAGLEALGFDAEIESDDDEA